MSDNSKIEWTSSTWNPTTGCTKVSPGCANCYIASTPPFRMAGRKFEKGHIPLILHEDRLTQPLHWAKPRRIFVNSLSDLFHKDIPDDFIAEVYGTMVAAYWHEFQVLTKRPERRAELLKSTVFRAKVTDAAARHVAALRGRCPDGCEAEDMRPLERWECASNALDVWEHEAAARNIWEGSTVENQHFADERIPVLLDTPAAVRFLSCEPLLGSVDLLPLRRGFTLEPDPDWPGDTWMRSAPGIDWVIVGGESGRDARDTQIEHIRSIVRQCQAAGVAVFYKQGGYHNRCPHDRKGGHFECFPDDLRVREMPGVGR